MILGWLRVIGMTAAATVAVWVAIGTPDWLLHLAGYVIAVTGGFLAGVKVKFANEVIDKAGTDEP